MTIDWDYPEPRKGFLGEWDKFIGPGATKTETILMLSFSLLGGVGMLLYSLLGNLEWNIAQIIIAVILATDLAGGVVANATSATKRWYHRREQGFWNHMRFVAFHIYPILIGLLYRDLDWVYCLVIYGFLIVSSVIILIIPQYLHRPVSFIVFSGAILMSIYAFPTPGLEWFIPILFLKITVGHIVKEEPYRPETKE